MQQVGVNAVFNVNAFVKGANTYIQTLNTVNVQTSQMVQQMNSATQAGGSGFNFLGHIISQTVGNAISYITWRVIPDMINKIQELAGAVLTMGMDFEEEMAVMKSVVDDPNVSMEQLGDAALAVGEDVTMLNASALGASKAITMLYKGGLSTATIFGDLNGYLAGTVPLTGALRTVFDFAAASGVDVAEAADLSVIALSTFGYEMETETQKAEFITRALDNMVRAANASVAEASDLAEAWKYVGPAAATAGYSVEDVNNALALLSNGGLQASTAGTSLNGMLVDLVETTAKSEAELKRLGVEVFNPMTGEMYPLVDIIGQFEVALKGASDRERIEALGKIFDIRGARAMNILLREGVDGWNGMATATYEATSMQDQAAIRLDTLSGRVEILKSLLTTLGVEGFLSVTDALQTLADVAATFVTEHGPKLVDFFTFVGDAFNGLVLLITENEDFMDSIKDAFAAIAEGNFTDAFLNIQEAFAQMFGEGERMNWLADLVPILSDITAVGPQLAEGFAALTGGDISGGIETIGDALKTAFGEESIGPIVDTVTNLVDIIMRLAEGDLSGVFEAIGIDGFVSSLMKGDWKSVGETILSLIAEGFINIAEFFAPLFEKGKEAIRSVDWIAVGQWIIQAIGEGLTAWQQTFILVWNKVADLVEEVDWEEVGNRAMEMFRKGLAAALVGIGKLLFTPIKSDAEDEGLWTQVAQAILRLIGAGLKASFKILLGAFKNSLQWAADAWKEIDWGKIGMDIITAIGNGLTGIGDAISEFFAPVVDKASEVWENVTTSVGEAWVGIKEAVLNGAVDISSSISEKWEEIKNKTQEIWDSITESISNAWNGLVEIASNIWQGIKDVIIVIVGTLLAYLTGQTELGNAMVARIWEILKEKAGEIFGAIKDKLSEIWTSIQIAVTTAWENIKTWLSETWDNLKTAAIEKWDALKESINEKNAELEAALPIIWENIKTLIAQKWEDLKTAATTKWEAIKTTVKTKVEELKTRLPTAWENIKTAATTAWQNIVDAITTKASEIKTNVEKKIRDVYNWIVNFDLKSAGEDLIQGMIDGVVSKANSLVSAATGAVNDAIAAAKALLGIESPSKVFMEIGGMVSKGMAIGIQNTSNDPTRALSNMVNSMTRMVNPAAAQSTVNNYSYTTLEINPTYSNYQSEAGLYYDAVAALSAVRN